METHSKIYYYFKPIGIDFSSEKEIKKHCTELSDFKELGEQFNKLKQAFIASSKDRCDIGLVFYPIFMGIVDIQVFHKISFKLFSKKVKKQSFYISASKYDNDGVLTMYSHETLDFSEVIQIFSSLVNDKELPRLNEWHIDAIIK
jgi:hypothetical protein